MSPAFTPVSAAVPAGSPAQAGSAPGPADPKAARTFRPITCGTAHGSAPPLVTGEPKVTLERDGDRITSIKIQCGCGHVIELACAY